MADESNQVVISYSVKDVLERLESKIDSRFDALTAAIGSKAEAADMAKVMATQVAHEQEIAAIKLALQTDQTQTTWRTEFRRWFVSIALTAALTATSIISMLHR